MCMFYSVFILFIWQVTTPDESNHVGTISKQWSGLAKEIFTDADNFGVSFPMDLDIKTKATVLGAVFLIVSYVFRNIFSSVITFSTVIILFFDP